MMFDPATHVPGADFEFGDHEPDDAIDAGDDPEEVDR